MDSLADPAILMPAAAIAVLAGIVKGMTGFAMPMILISGLSLFLPPDQALAALVLPTLVTNGAQALAQGLAAAGATIRRFRLYLAAGALALAASAQLVAVLPVRALFLAVGLPVTLFALMMLAGWQPRIPARRGPVEAGVGAVSGFVGGLSGIWGPPTVIWLTALGLARRDHIRAQGVIYALGALALLVAHLGSGVVNRATLPLSAALVPPALLGMWIGGRAADRIDQRQFRRLVLAVLVLAGANLLRRGLTG